SFPAPVGLRLQTECRYAGEIILGEIAAFIAEGMLQCNSSCSAQAGLFRPVPMRPFMTGSVPHPRRCVQIRICKVRDIDHESTMAAWPRRVCCLGGFATAAL